MQIDNALSPIFVEKFIYAMDKALYTQDGKHLKHNRGYRFASIGHAEEDGILPCWIMFGEGTSTSLLLSQHTNKPECNILRIVNYIYHIYAEFVNNKFERNFGKLAVKKWGLAVDDDGYFDSLMTMVSNPLESTYGMHDDGKPGLCEPNQPTDGVDGEYALHTHSKFNLVVPTVCIQNNSKKNTRIEFYDKKNRKEEPVGTIECSEVTIHLQLLGVQQTCTHIVSTPPFNQSYPHEL
jgi:hypothetical protein